MKSAVILLRNAMSRIVCTSGVDVYTVLRSVFACTCSVCRSATREWGLNFKVVFAYKNCTTV